PLELPHPRVQDRPRRQVFCLRTRDPWRVVAPTRARAFEERAGGSATRLLDDGTFLALRSRPRRAATMMESPMDFRAQRYRDRLRAEGRGIALRTARRTRDILDGYVSARKHGPLPPKLRVLWGRILVLGIGALTGVYYLAHWLF